MNATAFGLMTEVAELIRSKWAGDTQATVAVAEDPAHALDLLTAARPDSCSVVLFYLSDQADGDEFEEDTRLAAQIRVAIVKTPGLKLRSGEPVPAVLKLIDSFRAWMAMQTFESLLGIGGLVYKGMTHIPAAQGNVLHGYAMTFEAVYAAALEE